MDQVTVFPPSPRPPSLGASTSEPRLRQTFGTTPGHAGHSLSSLTRCSLSEARLLSVTAARQSVGTLATPKPRHAPPATPRSGFSKAARSLLVTFNGCKMGVPLAIKRPCVFIPRTTNAPVMRNFATAGSGKHTPEANTLQERCIVGSVCYRTHRQTRPTCVPALPTFM